MLPIYKPNLLLYNSMKKLHPKIALIFVLALTLSQIAQAETFDFKIVPHSSKSSSSQGYYTKIPLPAMEVKNGKLDFYKREGWDYISFEGTYNSTTGELTGVFTGATANNSPNSGGQFYCEFKAQINKNQKSSIIKYYPSYSKEDEINHCYAYVVFDFEKNRKSSKEPWWPDDLAFDIEPLETDLEDSGIRFSDIAGQVEVQMPSGYDADGEPLFEYDEWSYAKLDMPLPYGAKIRMDSKSRIILSAPDMTTFEMRTSDNPNDPVVEVILPSKAKGENVLKLMAGNLWHNIKKMVKDGSMDIEMGQAVAGIKGTTFVLTEDGKNSQIKVLEGEVSFKSKATGQSVLVKSGEKISASKAGFSEKEKFDTEDEIKKWEWSDYSDKPQNGFPSYLLVLAIVVVLAILLSVFFLKKKKA